MTSSGFVKVGGRGLIHFQEREKENSGYTLSNDADQTILCATNNKKNFHSFNSFACTANIKRTSKMMDLQYFFKEELLNNSRSLEHHSSKNLGSISTTGS
jgi:hypothetical protein